MKKTVFFLCAVVTFFLLHWHLSAQEDAKFRVIVHPENPITTLSKSEVSRMFLKKTTRWDQAGDVDPVDLDGKSAVREAFSDEIHGRSIASVKNYWQRQIFSGRAIPPPELGGEKEVVGFVTSRRGAIGYVGPNTNIGSARRVTIID